MNKKTSIIIAALIISVAITSLTFFISGQNAKMSCFKPDINGRNNPLLDEVRPPGTTSSDSPPVYATVRGFPFKYYRQAFPSNCTFNDGGSAPINPYINARNLILDLVAWFVLALVVLFGITRVRKKL